MKLRNSSPVRRSAETVLGLLLTSLLLVLPGRLLAADEERFSSPQAAVDALKAAVEARDTNALHAIFGPAAHGLVSADVVEAAAGAGAVRAPRQGEGQPGFRIRLQGGAATGRRRLALSHSAGETGRAMALRYRRRQRGDPQPAHWRKRAGRHPGLPRLRRRPSANTPAWIATGMACSNTPSICAAPRAPTTASTGPRGRAMNSVLWARWSRRPGSKATGSRPKS